MFPSSGSGHNKGLGVLFAGFYALLCYQLTSPHADTQCTTLHGFPYGLSGFNSSSHNSGIRKWHPCTSSGVQAKIVSTH